MRTIDRSARRPPSGVALVVVGAIVFGGCASQGGRAEVTLAPLGTLGTTIATAAVPESTTPATIIPPTSALAPPPETTVPAVPTVAPRAGPTTSASTTTSVSSSSTATSSSTSTTVRATTTTTVASAAVGAPAGKLLGAWVLQLGSVNIGASAAQVKRETDVLRAQIGAPVTVINGNDYADLTDGKLVYLSGPYATRDAALAACASAGLPSPDRCLPRLFRH